MQAFVQLSWMTYLPQANHWKALLMILHLPSIFETVKKSVQCFYEHIQQIHSKQTTYSVYIQLSQSYHHRFTVAQQV